MCILASANHETIRWMKRRNEPVGKAHKEFKIFTQKEGKQLRQKNEDKENEIKFDIHIKWKAFSFVINVHEQRSKLIKNK